MQYKPLGEVTPGLVNRQGFTSTFYMAQMWVSVFPSKTKWVTILWSCAQTFQKLRCPFPPMPFDKLLISATMNVTFAVRKRRRPHQKKATMSEWCSLLQERSSKMDVMSSVMLMKSVVFFSFHAFFCLQFHYLSAPGRVAAHLTAIGPNYEKICRQSVSHIIIFLPSLSDRKKQLKGMNCVKNSLSTSPLFWAKFPLWIRQ